MYTPGRRQLCLHMRKGYALQEWPMQNVMQHSTQHIFYDDLWTAWAYTHADHQSTSRECAVLAGQAGSGRPALPGNHAPLHRRRLPVEHRPPRAEGAQPRHRGQQRHRDVVVVHLRGIPQQLLYITLFYVVLIESHRKQDHLSSDHQALHQPSSQAGCHNLHCTSSCKALIRT